ncbi:hypothetical protein ACWCYZ_13685 [Streptomyces virginiae]
MLSIACRYVLIVVLGLTLGMALLWMFRTWGHQIGWSAFLAVETALVVHILLPRRR